MIINYNFTFDSGLEKSFLIELDNNDLEIVSKGSEVLPEWTLLSNYRCPGCSLNGAEYRYCPIAVNICEIIDFFKDRTSYDEVGVTVNTENRNFYKNTTIQNSLSSLLGIYMAASGCPSMAKLKPMVRFHLPFATVEETVFRSAGTYLLGQYFISKRGENADLGLINLARFYEDIQDVNRGIAERIRHVVGKDAVNNAVICLDMFAKELPYAIEDEMEDMKFLFKAYWAETSEG